MVVDPPSASSRVGTGFTGRAGPVCFCFPFFTRFSGPSFPLKFKVSCLTAGRFLYVFPSRTRMSVAPVGRGGTFCARRPSVSPLFSVCFFLSFLSSPLPSLFVPFSFPLWRRLFPSSCPGCGRWDVASSSLRGVCWRCPSAASCPLPSLLSLCRCVAPAVRPGGVRSICRLRVGRYGMVAHARGTAQSGEGHTFGGLTCCAHCAEHGIVHVGVVARFGS